MNEKLNISVEIITPEWASRELAEQEKLIANGDYNQRSLNDDTVDKYANDMRHGHWLLNNQGIGYDQKGHLIDGRHRLWAVKKSGVAVKMLVFRGLASGQNGSNISVMDTVDCGRTRGIASQLQIDGVKNAFEKASAVRAIGLLYCWPPTRKFGIIPTRQIMGIYGHGIEKVIKSVNARSRVRGSLVGMLAIYHDFKPRKAIEFATSYSTLTDLGQGSPVLTVKKFMETRLKGGTDQIVRAVRALALGLYHYDRDERINSIRDSEIGSDWLCRNQSGNRKAIREMMSLED